MVEFCRSCVMPNTRPGNDLDETGLCTACKNYSKKSEIDWDGRLEELQELCSAHRKGDGQYDCAIAVSGGKDSHAQVKILKDDMDMNPLLICVGSWSETQTGHQNFINLSSAFGCDIITLTPNLRAAKKISRAALIELGSPMWYFDRAIYSFPYNIAMKYGLKLLFYGENVSYEYGGNQKVETFDATKQCENGIAKEIDISIFENHGISENEICAVRPPEFDLISQSGLKPVYLSYFIPWDSDRNHRIAERCGFHRLTHEWRREGTIESYNQIDAPGYLINQWFKYPKFGHASATEMASRWIRAGLISRERGIEYVKDFDHILDQKILDDFLGFIGMENKEFWKIADNWYNQQLFERDRHGLWSLRRPIWKE